MLGPLREDSPRRIGPYAIRARLGAGGMGEVFLGDRGDGSGPAAVKTVRRDVAGDPGFRDRFRREITVARSVTGPRLASLLDGDADAEVPWLATEYVAGPTLSAAVRGAGAMDEAEVRMLGAGLARALAAVHAAGIVHRDVKPGNVMLAADGPRLIDFGIARDAGSTPLTTTSRMVGSPAFMSPEHVAGSGRVVAASDVFCLASVLCFAATGRDPFGDGPVAAVLYRVKYVEADLEEVPEGLRAVLEDCLSADPAARPTAAELAGRLTPGAAAEWPAPVGGQIAEYGRELARVSALDGPLLPGYTPTEAATGSRAAPHQLPTRGTDFAPGLHVAPTQGPGLGEPPRSRRRRNLVAALVALALLGAATGGLLALRGGDEGGDGDPEKPAAVLAGIDAQGGREGSGTVPYGRDVRPAGWHPWRSRMTGHPFGCAAGRDVLVCRNTAGSYEALSPSDGKKLWDYSARLDADEAGARISPTGQVFMPSGSTRPAVYGDQVLLASGDRLVSLDSRTGKVRWEVRAGSAHGFESAPLVADGLVFAAVGPTPQGARIAGFDLATGKEKWRRRLVGEDLAKAEEYDFWPLATRDKMLYLLGEGGLRALRTEDGAELGRATGEQTSQCHDALVRAPHVYCAAYTYSTEGEHMAVQRLGTPSLESAGEIPLPDELTDGAGLVAVDDHVVVLVRGARPWEEDDIDPEIVLARRDDGAALARYPLDRRSFSSRINAVSSPMIVADTLVWADSTSLYSVALHNGSKPGPLRTTVLKGAPGPELRKDYDTLQWGLLMSDEVLPPEVLPVGGAVYVIHHGGRVFSVPLPGASAS
ncbi:serine/threonine protein kinase [Streptomyces sp. CEV 2-1]|uniref:serine/threonine-protein kinase n=1 Tax=Streptomyces sp. CEV 2-1 TaxID=2485153 RepID=UPI000F9432E2|nr:serine/threonine-protein kinase [Streptomyces sp. CEV 2-1]ROQ82878.1 serine/threonine protein kinase [Streptomyces sp. CEV 2-1]